MRPLPRFAILAVAVAVGASAPPAEAQITVPRTLSATPDRFVTLEEQLINRLRATTEQQQAFVRYVVEQVRKERLERRLVLAIERYALKRNRFLPFNFFERALRFEASRRGVNLPPVQQFVTTASVSEE
jgi:acyl carrier protein phosphodiesterase